MSETQYDFIEPTNSQDFDAWIHTAGGRHVAKDLYRMASRYATRFSRYGKRVSMKLLWELERDRIGFVRARLLARGIRLEKSYGYALNNNYHAHMVRHMIQHHPAWAGLFETRELHE